MNNQFKTTKYAPIDMDRAFKNARKERSDAFRNLINRIWNGPGQN